MRQEKNSRLHVLRKFFTSPLFLILIAVFAVLYYEFFHYVVTTSNFGIFLVVVPLYLMYALILSSAVLLSFGIYAIKFVSWKSAALGETVAGIVTGSMGSVLASCGCQEPVLLGFLYLMGLNVIESSYIIYELNKYQIPLILIFIAINLILIYYQSGKLAKRKQLKK